MSDGQPYMRPAGLLWGRDAVEAVEAGNAGWLAGGTVAFTLIEMALRHEALVSRSWHSLPDLAASGDSEITQRLELITSARPAIAGLDANAPAIMGIVNVTPDSFSDGGQAYDGSVAIAQGRALAAAGAQIVDVGGESTRPGAVAVGLEEELARVMPVVKALCGDGLVVSIDTRKAEVMRLACAAGAKIINDVSALTHDKSSPELVRDLGVPAILMHAQGDPKTMQANPVYDDVALDVFDVLDGWLGECEAFGIERAQLLVDPGIGFGKTFGHNLDLISRLSLFHGLGAQIVFGASRKAFIGAVSGEKTAGQRVNGSIAAAVNAVMQGAQIVRVHDVRQTVEALSVWRAGVDPSVAAV